MQTIWLIKKEQRFYRLFLLLLRVLRSRTVLFSSRYSPAEADHHE
jgi:hypothetical protein